MITSGELISATCAVYINGSLKGTAWLASRNGHLLTAAHVLGQKESVDRVDVRFVDGEFQKAIRIFWSYHQEIGLDFAVLRLIEPFSNRKPLPIKLAEPPVGTMIRAYGYGEMYEKTFYEGSPGPGEGRYAGPLPLKESPKDQLYVIYSKVIGMPGYSGCAIYSDDLNGVVALQSTAQPQVEQAYAVPLSRIANECPNIFSQFEVNSDEFYANTNYVIRPTLSRDLPKNIDELVAGNDILRQRIQRKKEINDLSRFFSDYKPGNKHVVLYYGLPLIGKTDVVKSLIGKIERPLLPIYTDIDLVGSTTNLDDFLFSLADQIATEISQIDNGNDYYQAPILSKFKEGKGKSAFLRLWKQLSKRIMPILIIDNFRTLFSGFSGENEILSFITDFLDDINNGMFVIVCREVDLRSNNKYMQKIISYSEIRRIDTYPQGTTLGMLDLMQKKFSMTDDVKFHIGEYCDDFPFVVQTMLNSLIKYATDKGDYSINLNDLHTVADNLVQENRYILRPVFLDLSELERVALWKLSGTEKDIGQEGDASNNDFPIDLAGKYSQGLPLLLKRGWINRDRKCNFRFLLSYISKYYPTMQEVLDVNK